MDNSRQPRVCNNLALTTNFQLTHIHTQAAPRTQRSAKHAAKRRLPSSNCLHRPPSSAPPQAQGATVTRRLPGSCLFLEHRKTILLPATRRLLSQRKPGCSRPLFCGSVRPPSLYVLKVATVAAVAQQELCNGVLCLSRRVDSLAFAGRGQFCCSIDGCTLRLENVSALLGAPPRRAGICIHALSWAAALNGKTSLDGRMPPQPPALGHVPC